MSFYQCRNEDLLLNLHHCESISIKNEHGIYEIRANMPDSLHYVLETFEDIEEARKFLNYIIESVE